MVERDLRGALARSNALARVPLATRRGGRVPPVSALARLSLATRRGGRVPVRCEGA